MGRRKKKRRGRVARLGRGLRKTLAVLIGVALLVAVLTGGTPFHSWGGGPSPGPKTAAIVDQLSLTQPNPAFAEQATDLLHEGGYGVDYYPGEEVTVDFYRNLPTYDYDLVIIRGHSGRVRGVNLATGESAIEEYVGLFTGEPYSRLKYREEQQPGVGGLAPLGRATYFRGGDAYFAIEPTFIEDSMKGRFDDTLIVMMGCDGLRSQRTAQAFLDKGARAFVSWSQPVSASHTDAATQRLLEKLLVEGLTVGDAVAQTATEVGPDPLYGAEFRVLAEGE